MASESSSPFETLGVSAILHALEINCDSADGETEPYLVIPGNSGPRWMLPARSSAAASVLDIWHPYNLSSRMKWLAIRLAARAGLLRFAPSVSIVKTSCRGAQLWFDRCGIQTRNAEIVVLVGTPSANRKLIAFLLDDRHRIAAVLKVGLTAGGGVCILHEAEVLGKLERYSWAPRLLSVHPDLRAAAQQYMPGAMSDREFRPEYMDVLCQLPRSGGCKSLAAFADEMANRLSPFKAQFDKLAPGLLDRSLSCLNLDITVPTMLVHGDFAPWNILNNPEVGLVLVDWEWADFAGLPAHDLLHFHFSIDLLFGEKAGVYSAFQSSTVCAEYFRRMDLDLALLPRLAIAYLLHQLLLFNEHLSPAHAAYLLRQLAAITKALSPVSHSGASMPER
jgi:hypothetical protein